MQGSCRFGSHRKRFIFSANLLPIHLLHLLPSRNRSSSDDNISPIHDALFGQDNWNVALSYNISDFDTAVKTLKQSNGQFVFSLVKPFPHRRRRRWRRPKREGTNLLAIILSMAFVHQPPNYSSMQGCLKKV
jgi:hypothetical protein